MTGVITGADTKKARPDEMSIKELTVELRTTRAQLHELGWWTNISAADISVLPTKAGGSVCGNKPDVHA